MDETWQWIERIDVLGGAGSAVWIVASLLGGAVGWVINQVTHRPMKKRLAALEARPKPDEGALGTPEERFAASAPQMREDLPVLTDPNHKDCGPRRAYWVFRLQQFDLFPPLAWEDRMWELVMPAYLADADAGDLEAALARRGHVAKLMLEEARRNEPKV